MKNFETTDGSNTMAIPSVGQMASLLVFHAALLLVTIAPILSVEFLPLADLPNHLARLHILANLDTVPALRENYQVVWTLAPNLLVDMILTPAARIWSVYDVGRVFVLATMVGTYGGILMLSVMFFSRLTLWPALALPILYNHAFSWGFLSFNFGVGAALWLLVLWFHLQDRSVWVRLAILICVSPVLYLTHMFAFGLFAAVVSAHCLSVAYRQDGSSPASILRALMVVVPPFILTLMVYGFWLANDGAAGEKVVEYGDLAQKSAALVSPTMFSDSVADGFLLILYLIVGLHLARRGELLLTTNMALPLIGLAILCLVMPGTLFGVWGVDFRLPPVLLMLFIAATQPEALFARPLQPVMTVAIAAVVLVRAITIWPQLQLADREFREFRDAAREIAEGARVLVSQDDEAGVLALPPRAYANLALFAVIERSAFVPNLFTGNMQIRPADRNRAIDAAYSPTLRSDDVASGLDPEFRAYYRSTTIDNDGRVYWAAWPKHFDYLVRISPAPLDERVSAELEAVKKFSFFEIAKIRKPK